MGVKGGAWGVEVAEKQGVSRGAATQQVQVAVPASEFIASRKASVPSAWYPSLGSILYLDDRPVDISRPAFLVLPTWTARSSIT